MGGDPYWYIVDYQPNVDDALQALRQREFAAGRYNPRTPFPEFPIGPNSPAPGAGHGSIDEALEASAESGTRSILDLMRVSEAPEMCAVSAVDEESLEEFFGTAKPDRATVEENMFELLEDVGRGEGVYVTIYEGDRPAQLLFAGYSVD